MRNSQMTVHRIKNRGQTETTQMTVHYAIIHRYFRRFIKDSNDAMYRHFGTRLRVFLQ